MHTTSIDDALADPFLPQLYRVTRAAAEIPASHS